jgi:hypothetical protein
MTELFLLGIAIAREFIGQFKRLESSWLTYSVGWSHAMSEPARKPAGSSHALHAISGPSPLASIDLANEKHYSVIEIANLWALSEKTVRKIFEREPGVIHWCSEEKLHRRGYRTLRVPETILYRVHRKLRRVS